MTMRQLSARLLAITPGSAPRLAGLVALLLAITGTHVGQGILVARALGRIIQGGEIASILPPVGLIALLQVARFGLTTWRESAAIELAGEVKAQVRQLITMRLFELGLGFTQRTRTGTLQSTIVDGVETLDPLVARFLPQAFATALGAAGVATYLIVLDPVVGLVVLVCAAVAPALPLVSGRLTEEPMTAWFAGYRGLYAEMLDAVQGMATLKAFNASGRRGRELDAQARRFCRDSVRLNGVVILYVAVVALVVGVGSAVVAGLGAVRLANGELTAVQLLTILILSGECFRPLHSLEKAYHASYRSGPAGREIFALLDTQPEITDGPCELSPSGAHPLAVAFEDVTFRYRPGDAAALDGFRLDIAPGERVALVGRSGAGKTTTVSLLLRFFDPSRGRITIGGQDIATVPLDQLRARIALVSQDTYLFHGTLRHNLLLARPDASEEEIVAAAQAARAHEFIAALPRGYDTVVGERGLKLSGGQRQRIAIARALLSKAPILVLDEATSSVDAASEAAIQRAVDTLTTGRTTLVIAHRLSTVRGADRIVVLDAGRVVEVGPHAALLAERGAYADLVAAQEGST